ncbi:hypothetical protein E2C01_076999 [Portunus trituberculatus]|uniref:Uncharacterized protein n=1 Tax=Portunus trituberculatus TaxID=210409 RepID=A0A5B7ID75_PORTR|nr:hypothetical protein [Portunus trituberculatus]
MSSEKAQRGGAGVMTSSTPHLPTTHSTGFNLTTLGAYLDKASQEEENEGDEEEEPVHDLDIKTLTECLGGIEKAL